MTMLDPSDFAHADEQAYVAGLPPGEDPQPAPGTPEDAVTQVSAAAAALNEALLGYGPDEWQEAVRLLHDLRKATAVLATADASLVRWLYLHGEHGIHLRVEGVPGDVAITRGRAKERWEGTAAAQDYVARRIIENDGELPDPEQVVEWVLEVVPASKCRVTPLREHGLEVEDYRTSEPGNLQVTLPRPDLTT